MKKKNQQKLFSRSQIFFYILSALIFIFVVVYFTEIKKDIKLFGTINPYWLALALFGQVCTYFSWALIYQRLLYGFKINIKQKLWQLFQVSIVTLFFNQTVPSAGISGNTFLFNFLRKRNIPVGDIVSLVSVELLSFYAAMNIVVVIVLFTSIFFFKIPSLFLVILSAGFVVYVGFGLAIEFFTKKQTINTLVKKFKSIKFLTKLANNAREIFPVNTNIERPSQFFLKHESVVLQATGLQLCVFIADSFTIFALFLGFGVPVNVFVIAAAFILAKIISILPISPGALILYEGSMSFFFSGLGVKLETAIVVTLLYRALSFWLPILVGFFLYKKLETE